MGLSHAPSTTLLQNAAEPSHLHVAFWSSNRKILGCQTVVENKSSHWLYKTDRYHLVGLVLLLQMRLLNLWDWVASIQKEVEQVWLSSHILSPCWSLSSSLHSSHHPCRCISLNFLTLFVLPSGNLFFSPIISLKTYLLGPWNSVFYEWMKISIFMKDLHFWR